MLKDAVIEWQGMDHEFFCYPLGCMKVNGVEETQLKIGEMQLWNFYFLENVNPTNITIFSWISQISVENLN